MAHPTTGQKHNESLEIHLPCPSPMCIGNVIFEGVKDGESYYKCCICEKEFNAREVNHNK